MKKRMVTLNTWRLQRAEILRLAEKYGARNVRVFGSVVRAESRDDSDVDLLVEFDKGKSLLDLIGFKLDLEDLLGAKVDVVTPGILRYIRDRVLAEALPSDRMISPDPQVYLHHIRDRCEELISAADFVRRKMSLCPSSVMRCAAIWRSSARPPGRSAPSFARQS